MATKNIVPRADGEGSLGRAAKQWGDAQVKKINGKTPAEFVAAETPKAHALDAHNAVTLAELNAKISDATIPSDAAATTSAAGLVELATDAEVQTGTATGLAVTPASLKAYTEWRPSGMKNLLINGNASRLINQRGIQNGDVFTPGGWRYTFDQWKMACNCASVEFIKEPDAAGIRILDATGGTFFHPFVAIIEMDEDLGGRTFTLTMDFLSNIDSPSTGVVGSITFRNGANGTGSDVGYSPAIKFNSPGTRKKASVTATAPSGARSMTIFSGGVIADGNYVKYYNIQLEEGSVATPFEQRPIGLELALCQRYYQTGSDCGSGGQYDGGYSRLSGGISLPVVMRSTPTCTVDVSAATILEAGSVTNKIADWTPNIVGVTPGLLRNDTHIAANKTSVRWTGFVYTASAEI